MRSRSLPRIIIPIPCTADWRAMEPIAADSRARLCRSCDKPVYDSKSMTRAELHTLIMKPRDERPAWLRPPQKRSDIDRAPPLRHLASEEELLPPAWRD
jgi:hypothetical protein